MPPQKNSGNRAAKKNRESGASMKSRKEAEDLFTNIHNLDEKKHVSRVIRNFGNGRVEVVYAKREKNRIEMVNSQATIRGSFRGRGKRDVWVDIGSFVVAEENLGILEIVGILTRQQMKEIVALDDTYKKVLNGEETEENDFGIEFDDRSDEEDENKPKADSGVVAKKDKVKHNRENIPVDRGDSDIDIDDI